jgi:hypothetical protein
MTSKLVVIINSFKVPNITKILLYEMKFLVLNYSCLQNPWLGGSRPQLLVLSVLCPQPNLLNPPNKIPRYAAGSEFPLCAAIKNRPRINSRVILYEANWSDLLTLHFKIKHVASKIIYIVKVLFSELNR